MKNKTVWVSIIMLWFLNFLSVVMAQTPQLREAQSAPNGCEQFKGIVTKPDSTTDHKMRTSKPDEAMDYKGIVVNPCQKKTMVRLLPLPTNPRFNRTGKAPTPETQNPSADSPVKQITEMVNSSELLEKARLSKGKSQ